MYKIQLNKYFSRYEKKILGIWNCILQSVFLYVLLCQKIVISNKSKQLKRFFFLWTPLNVIGHWKQESILLTLQNESRRLEVVIFLFRYNRILIENGFLTSKQWFVLNWKIGYKCSTFFTSKLGQFNKAR